MMIEQMWSAPELRDHLIPHITPIEITAMDRAALANAIHDARQAAPDCLPLSDEQAAQILYDFYVGGGWLMLDLE
jgi:hypothetical protein